MHGFFVTPKLLVSAHAGFAETAENRS